VAGAGGGTCGVSTLLPCKEGHVVRLQRVVDTVLIPFVVLLVAQVSSADPAA
jgi:hypothetical protein